MLLFSVHSSLERPIYTKKEQINIVIDLFVCSESAESVTMLGVVVI